MSRQIFSQHFLMLMTKIFDHLSYFTGKVWGDAHIICWFNIADCRMQKGRGGHGNWPLKSVTQIQHQHHAHSERPEFHHKKILNAGKTSNEQTKRRKGRGYKGTQSSLLKRYLLSQAITFMHLFSDICTFNNYYSCRLWLKYKKNF